MTTNPFRDRLRPLRDHLRAPLRHIRHRAAAVATAAARHTGAALAPTVRAAGTVLEPVARAAGIALAPAARRAIAVLASLWAWLAPVRVRLAPVGGWMRTGPNRHPVRFRLVTTGALVGAVLLVGAGVDVLASSGGARTNLRNSAQDSVAALTPAATGATKSPAAPGQQPAQQPAQQTPQQGLAQAPQQAAAATPSPAVTVPATMELPYQYQLQTTYYYCGPAAARIAASTFGKALSQDAMAGLLGTTENGTDSPDNVTHGLNVLAGGPLYHTTQIPGQWANAAQVQQLRADVVRAINDHHAVVANIVGSVVDTQGVTHDYSGGHYLTIVGYGASGDGLMIADPADTAGNGTYWLTATTMANWMSYRGYSS